MLNFYRQIFFILINSLLISSISIKIDSNKPNENSPTISHLFEMIQNYWQKNVSLPLCTNSVLNNCCSQTVLDICDVCEEPCPCLCTQKRSITESSVSPSISQPLTQPATASESISFSAYTLILSVGLPSVSIILIICTLLSITYCCKPRPIRASDINSTANNEPAVSVSNLSLVYINLDENNNGNLGDSTTNLNSTKNPKEPPPKYSDYIKSSFVDKLPSYKSFRGKKIDQQAENGDKQ